MNFNDIKSSRWKREYDCKTVRLVTDPNDRLHCLHAEAEILLEAPYMASTSSFLCMNKFWSYLNMYHRDDGPAIEEEEFVAKWFVYDICVDYIYDDIL